MSDSTAIPRHIAIVMDGNGRWANKRFLPRLAGHKKGVDALRNCVSHSMSRGVQVLTLFAFSSENWNRPAEEVSGLMHLLGLVLAREVPSLHAQGVRLHFVGERASLSEKVQAGFEQAERLTCENDKLVLNICFNYGGRWDVAQAAARLVQEGKPITEEGLNAAMSLAHVDDPDLVIRTGGEYRISNFLLWQSAYAELYFTPALWPDFGSKDLDAAISDFALRERRFGKTSDQLKTLSDQRLSI